MVFKGHLYSIAVQDKKKRIWVSPNKKITLVLCQKKIIISKIGQNSFEELFSNFLFQEC